ncbi:DNA-directed RNA polymerase subunit delta [Paenibacillus sacheonensis]|uniref:Probable DNA-directed RNA polymerase subunit delta n=1 Tax=Paenibacillus sacheonensis TaxID=742054 RepID=A0A7X4YRJ8_9BACL|nr:DNA-directed RNA polymerase subunit delta [Paenibacillus sacheonensis]MBM7567657.1 DNA-directed RNA polymerase subunit delta [Paenibacillus sacheonensis]NBC71240.1 DNA-directed RNA polymerase subunit delta [Paenibacillus sacheonensis]
MSSEIVLKIDPERVKEMPMVDLAFELLKAANTPFYYRDIMMEIAKIRGLSQEQINQVIAQVYTEINIDGRFACVGSNMWGLKRWYPVERNEDPVGNAKRSRIINDEDDDDDAYVDEEEDTYAAEDDDFDSYDEDQEIFDEAEEEAEVDEEVLIDDEESEEESVDEDAEGAESGEEDEDEDGLDEDEEDDDDK